MNENKRIPVVSLFLSFWLLFFTTFYMLIISVSQGDVCKVEKSLNPADVGGVLSLLVYVIIVSIFYFVTYIYLKKEASGDIKKIIPLLVLFIVFIIFMLSFVTESLIIYFFGTVPFFVYAWMCVGNIKKEDYSKVFSELYTFVFVGEQYNRIDRGVLCFVAFSLMSLVPIFTVFCVIFLIIIFVIGSNKTNNVTDFKHVLTYFAILGLIIYAINSNVLMPKFSVVDSWYIIYNNTSIEIIEYTYFPEVIRIPSSPSKYISIGSPYQNQTFFRYIRGPHVNFIDSCDGHYLKLLTVSLSRPDVTVVYIA